MIVFQDKGEVIEIGGYAKETTNNKMELTAIKTALELLRHKKVSPDTPIVIHTDSSYAINGITKWTKGWMRSGWVTQQKTDVLNAELWKPLAELERHFTKLKFEHVRGHAGVWGNERCDQIATTFATGSKPALFHGKLSGYDVRILSRDVSMKPSKSGSSKKSGPAHSYVSLLDGVVKTHKTWDACKARVHGKPAKYQKVFSADEEKKLVTEWSK